MGLCSFTNENQSQKPESFLSGTDILIIIFGKEFPFNWLNTINLADKDFTILDHQTRTSYLEALNVRKHGRALFCNRSWPASANQIRTSKHLSLPAS